MAGMRSLKTTYTVANFVSWSRSGTLELRPEYQRHSVWKKPQKSLLMDTIIRGLPVPILFLRDLEMDMETLEQGKEVVDGQQRLRTILGFIDSKVLRDYDPKKDEFTISKTHNKEFAGKTFRQLPPDVREAILNYEFSVHVLPASVADSQVFEIFSRINSSGSRLNPQEVRNATYIGEFKTSSYKMAFEFESHFKQWGVFTANDFVRMTEVEAVSDLYGLMLKGVRSKSKGFIDSLYKAYDQTFEGREEAERRLRHVFDQIDVVFPAGLARTPFSHLAYFYALFALIYDRTIGIGTLLDDRPSLQGFPRNLRQPLLDRATQVSKGEVAPQDPKVIPTKNTQQSREFLVGQLREACGIEAGE